MSQYILCVKTLHVSAFRPPPGTAYVPLTYPFFACISQYLHRQNTPRVQTGQCREKRSNLKAHVQCLRLAERLKHIEIFKI
jgi:hypothetical protein